MYAADLVGSCPQYCCILAPFVGGVGRGTWVRAGGGGGWHTVGCLRDQMPLSPELVLMFLGGMWVGFWA